MTDIVHVENLVKRYDDLIALDHFNLNIAPGEIFGLLGPNGSGKTTSINCILQLLAYDKGTIELFGEPMTPARYDLKRRIGVVPQQWWRGHLRNRDIPPTRQSGVDRSRERGFRLRLLALVTKLTGAHRRLLR